MNKKMNCQERILAIMELLSWNTLKGRRNKDLADELRIGQVTICRDISVLEKQGWIEQGPDGRWRPSAKFGRIGKTVEDYYVLSITDPAKVGKT